jgi:anti-sigma regulatory factor (Ser/Thr protein kinase)
MALEVQGQLCVYSRHDLHPRQVEAGRSSHALIHQDGATRDNPGAEATDELLRRLIREPVTRPAGPPSVHLADPSLMAARHAIGTAALDARLGVDPAAALLFGVNEAVSNAQEHGGPSVVVQTWVSPGRVQVIVTDTGPGPLEPTIGLLRQDEDGVGMWLAHQLVDVRHEVGEAGYAVHLTASRQGPTA